MDWRARAAPPRPAAQKKSLIAIEQRPEQRRGWAARVAAIPVERLVFLDETSTQTVMTRRRGRAPRGVRLRERVPRNHGKNQTLLVAIRVAGVLEPLVFPRALDGVLFARWVRDRLVPLLRPGQIVVLDNLSVHKNAAAIAAAGCEVGPLPVYSPELNPIELVLARLKAHLRGCKARVQGAGGSDRGRPGPGDARPDPGVLSALRLGLIPGQPW